MIVSKAAGMGLVRHNFGGMTAKLSCHNRFQHFVPPIPAQGSVPAFRVESTLAPLSKVALKANSRSASEEDDGAPWRLPPGGAAVSAVRLRGTRTAWEAA